jgi:hypothetical protein
LFLKGKKEVGEKKRNFTAGLEPSLKAYFRKSHSFYLFHKAGQMGLLVSHSTPFVE